MKALVRGFGVLILGAAAIAGCNTPVKVENAPKLKAVEILDSEELAPIKFSRIGVNVPRGEVIGTYEKASLGCSVYVPSYIYWNSGRVLQRDIEFEDLFYGEMSAANFNVVGDPENLFEDAERERIEPEFLVGGQIEDIKMHLCAGLTFFHGGRVGPPKGKSSVRVSWQVFSVFDKKVVYATETKGSIHVKEATRGGEAFFITEAFADAVANLAADEKLVAILRKKPRTLTDVRDVEASELPIPYRPVFDAPITDNIDLIRRSVVTLDIGNSHGSGFFISPNLILTNHHVVANEDLLRVHLITGRKVLGEVIRRHPERDVALVQVEAAGHQPLPLRLEPVKITEDVYAIGAPRFKELAGTVSKGIVSKFMTNEYGLEDIQADVDIHGGNSGGPLLDGNGNVVGIAYAGLLGEKKSSTGLNFFIPIYDALDKLNVSLDRTRGKVVVQ